MGDPFAFRVIQGSCCVVWVSVSLFDLTELQAGAQSHNGLTIHNPGNDDWFEYFAESSGSLNVDIFFSDDEGDLELRLLTPEATELAVSSTMTNNEHVSWEVFAGQSYFIHVSGFQDDTNGSYDLRINTGNSRPTISDIANRSISEDESTGTISLTVGDEETPASLLTVTAKSSNEQLVPDDDVVLSGSGSSRSLVVTPAADQSGFSTITVTVDDGDGGINTTSFRLTVNPVNDAPVITSSNTAGLPENTTSVTTVTSTDIDGGVPTYSIASGLDGELFVIDANTGTLRFITPPDFESPADSDGDNEYRVQVQVDDDNGGITSQTIRVTVTNVADESAPTVDIVNVSPDPRAGVVDEIIIEFSSAVTGFDLGDLSLTRTNDSVSSLLPGSATLSTTDNITWRLATLDGLTVDSGVYELTLDAASAEIQDLQGGVLAAGATDRWINGAGDANGDHEFNQLDLIQVLVPMKYLTGEAATWGEGDWNGDGVFNQFDILATQQTQPTHYLNGPFGARSSVPDVAHGPLGHDDPASASVLPEPVTVGMPRVDAAAAADIVMAQIADASPLPTDSDSVLAKQEGTSAAADDAELTLVLL